MPQSYIWGAQLLGDNRLCQIKVRVLSLVSLDKPVFGHAMLPGWGKTSNELVPYG